MGTTDRKEALLFYRDGQVKFTHCVVKDTDYGYRESFAQALMLDHLDEYAPRMPVVEYRDFRFRGDVARYRIFEEVD